MRIVAACLLLLGLALPAAAQPTGDATLAFRPFVMISGERFTAKKTFDAVFGQSSQLFWGVGLQVTESDGWYVDVALSRFKKTGERAFVAAGQTFSLGIPVTVTLTPIELTAGYRFRVGSSGRFRPYVGIGAGSYGYSEVSKFSDTGDNVHVHHTGFLGVGGVEYRVYRWVTASADVQYTSVSGVLGKGGLSEQFKEKNLGGIAARFRILIGR
jgi:hypothetical protein